MIFVYPSSTYPFPDIYISHNSGYRHKEQFCSIFDAVGLGVATASTGSDAAKRKDELTWECHGWICTLPTPLVLSA